MPGAGEWESFGRRLAISVTDRGTTIRTALDPPLDLGLDLHPQSILDDTLDEALGPRDVTVGDSAFDPMVRVGGDEPERVRALLVPGVRASLFGLLRLGTYFTVSDAAVSVSGIGDGDWLSMAGRVLADVAIGLEEARLAVPAAALLGSAAAALAPFGARGLTLSRTPLRAAGSLDGLQVSVAGSRRDRDHFEVALSVAPEERQGPGLRVHRRGGLASLAHAAGALFGAADQAFDARYAVELARPGPDPRALVDERARAHVLAVAAAASSVAVDDGAVEARLRFAPGRSDDLAVALDEALGLARRLDENLRRLTSAESGPYR